MERQKKLIIAIIIVLAIAIGTVVWGMFLSTPNLSDGEKNILVLAVDETEQRPGMGGVDMAFIINMDNGSIEKYTPVYPGGLSHPTQPSPVGGGNMMLHDSLWDSNIPQGMEYAKEIVEGNTKTEIDAVVAVNTEAIDAIIASAGTLEVNGNSMNISALDLVRENDQLHGGGMTRGEAVLALAKAISQAATDTTKREAMVQTALDQYSKGNIIMIPEGSFIGLMAAKGLEHLAN
ncbi:MAG: DUF4012 domain-containing protein [Methanobrevibacter sp.]|jgi:anionic cell wall polymer biosynthesis LytR-Cps2A-Psr (LCP) family protein|nr:DUF4012 domain-containing protein [Methanobrevibacter sp.]